MPAMLTELRMQKLLMTYVGRQLHVTAMHCKSSSPNFGSSYEPPQCSKGGAEEDNFFEALAKDGSKAWSIELSKDCEKSAEEICHMALPTLLSLLPGKAMKTLAKYVEEARLALGL